MTGPAETAAWHGGCLAIERCGLQEDRSCGLQEGGPARSVSTESIKWSKVLGRRGGLCLVDTLTGLITRRGSGTTGGALCCKRIKGATASRESHTQTPDLGARPGATSGALRSARNGEKRGYTALHGSFTQRLDLGARSGVWNDMASPAWWAQWKETVLRPCKGRWPRPTTK